MMKAKGKKLLRYKIKKETKYKIKPWVIICILTFTPTEKRLKFFQLLKKKTFKKKDD